MKNFISTVLLSLSVVLSVHAQEKANSLPTIPDDCFTDTSYCTSKQTIPSEAGTIFEVSFFGLVSENDYDSAQSILDVYYDCPGWKQKHFTQIKTLRSSEELKLSQDPNMHYQYLDYDTKLPFGVLQVEEVSAYKKITPAEGALLSVDFHTINDKPVLLNNGQELASPKGVKSKTGTIHVQYVPELQGYVIYMITQIQLNIDLLPEVSSDIVEKTMIDIAKGLFQL